MISNSGHDERGKYRGGKAGDQTGTEWQIQPWYSRPWTIVFWHPNPEVNRWISTLAREAAGNDRIGYDQNQRTSFWKQLEVSGYRPANIKTDCEADCSAGVAAIVKAAGYLLGSEKLKDISPSMYTGNQIAVLQKAGFEAHRESRYLTSDRYLPDGAILLCEGHHTAINVTRGDLCDVPEKSSTGSSGGSTTAIQSGEKASGRTLNRTPKWTGRVTASSLNVRTWAGTENPKLKSWPRLGFGNLVDVCDTVKAANGADWYYIRINGKVYGFASARYIRRV